MISPKQKSQYKIEISINFSVYAYISKNLQMESNTLRTCIINYNHLVCDSTMCFECCPVFGRWVKFSCITMSLLLAHLSRRLIGELIVYPWSGVRHSSYVRRRRRPQCSNIFFSETAGPIKAKFYVEPPWVGGTIFCSRHLGHMTKMAATPIYGKNPSKIFFSRTVGPIFTKLGM